MACRPISQGRYKRSLWGARGPDGYHRGLATHRLWVRYQLMGDRSLCPWVYLYLPFSTQGVINMGTWLDTDWSYGWMPVPCSHEAAGAVYAVQGVEMVLDYNIYFACYFPLKTTWTLHGIHNLQSWHVICVCAMCCSRNVKVKNFANTKIV